MRAMLGPIRPADRERLADWYAAQPAAAGAAPSNPAAVAAPAAGSDPAQGPE
jgi:cytochrome c553